MGRCARCGGSVIAMTRDLRPHPRRRLYGCSYAWKRGPTVCQTTLKIRQEILDQAVLQAIQDALDEHALEAAVENALKRLQSDQERHPIRRTTIERELSLVQARERHLVEAIKHGESLEPLLAALKVEEERRKALANELEALAGLAQVASLNARRLRQDLKARVADVKDLLGRHVPQARQVLSKLLVDRLTLEPVDQDGHRGYRFYGQGTYGGLLAGDTSVGDPGGFWPWVARGSNLSILCDGPHRIVVYFTPLLELTHS